MIKLTQQQKDSIINTMCNTMWDKKMVTLEINYKLFNFIGHIKELNIDYNIHLQKLRNENITLYYTFEKQNLYINNSFKIKSSISGDIKDIKDILLRLLNYVIATIALKELKK